MLELVVRLVDGPVRPGPLVGADRVELVHQLEHGLHLPYAFLGRFELPEEALHARAVFLVFEHLLEDVDRFGRLAAQLLDLIEPVRELLRRRVQAVRVEAPVGFGDRWRGSGRGRGQCFGQLHAHRVLFGQSALGRVDHGLGRFGEIALELLQISHHLLVGVDGAAFDVRLLLKLLAVAHDPLPLHHFQRVEGTQLPGPHVVDGRAGAVVEPVREAQVLTDQDDGIAAQMLSQVEGQVRDGRARLHRHARRCQVAQELVEESAVRHPNWPGKAVHDRGISERLGHQGDVWQFTQSLIEATRDLVVVQRRDEIRLQPALQQRLERCLGTDEDDVVPHLRVAQQVHVPRQARPGPHAHGGKPGRGAVQCIGRGAADVVSQIVRQVPAGAGGVHERRGDIRAAEGRHFADHLPELIESGTMDLPAGRVSDQDSALSQQCPERLDAPHEAGPIHLLVGQNHVRVPQPRLVVHQFKRRPHQWQARLVHDDNRSGPTAADDAGQFRDVVSQPKPQHDDASVFVRVEHLHEPPRLSDRVVSTGQTQ